MFKFKFNKYNNAGLLLTISFHLIVLIIFLSYSIKSVSQKETSFVLDFTKQEQLEKEIEQMQFKESVSKELDQLLSAAKSQKVRNATVNASSNLKDDRNKNPQDIYDQANKLQAKLDASRRQAEKEQITEDDAVVSKKETKNKADAYKGPSVLSWRLDGRRAISLPIPAYKCQGGGDVAVAIIVNRKGYVKAAKVIDNRSSSDPCLREYAINAAKRSRFSASSSADERQAGDILYRFIAQ